MEQNNKEKHHKTEKARKLLRKQAIGDVKKIKATEVRQNFQEFIDKVHYTREAILISKHGKPWVFIQPLSESDSEARDLLTN